MTISLKLGCAWIVLTLAAAPSIASSRQEPDSRLRQGYVGQASAERVELTGVVDVPITLESNLPIVEVRVNGEGPFRFGIETGADFVVVSPDLAARLSLKRTDGTGDFPAYRLDSIAIGAARFIGVPVSATRFAQGGIDGVLGLPLYRDLLLTIDYPKRRATFQRGALPAADNASILALTHIGPFWGVPITIAGTPFAAVLDTRSTGGFGLTPESSRHVPFDGDLQVIGRARGAAIEETEVKAGRIAGDIAIGRYVFPRPMATVRPLPPGFPTEPLIGGRVLSQFVVTLDQRNARLRLDRAGAEPIVLEEPGPRPMAAAAGTASPPSDYVGRYGVREIRVDEGKLVLQRDGGPPLELIATGKDAFTLKEAPQAQIKFTRDAAGAVVAVEILNRDGQWETERRIR
jgi:hypothetical protein